MSTIKNPVGPQPSNVYWRRRLVVLLGLIAVIVIIVLIIVGRGSAADTGGTEPSPKPGASTSPDPSVAPGAADGAACDPAQITVGAITDQGSYAAGELPQLSLSVTNTGANNCLLNAGTSQQVYTITSGKDQYWISTDCQEGAEDAEVLLEAGQTVTGDAIEWDRTRSAPDTCDAETRPDVPAGGASYYLTTAVGEIESAAPRQFLLN